MIRKCCQVLAPLGLFVLLGAIVADTSQSFHVSTYPRLSDSRNRRQLPGNTLECPANDLGISGTSDGDAQVPNILQALSTGKFSISMIQMIRGKNPAFYQSVLNNAIMATCDVESESERCVEFDSPFAAKDWNGTCIEASDTSCTTGFCERYSNCYWKPVVPGQPRATRFPPEDYAKATEALVGYKKDSYAGGLLLHGAIGILVALLILLLWIIFIVARYCCCCLWRTCSVCRFCSPIPRRQGYNQCLEMTTPILVYVLCLAGIAFCGVVAFIGNMDVDRAATGAFFHSSELMEDAKLFLLKSQTPLIDINSIARDAALAAKQIFDGTDFVGDGALKILASFTDYASYHAQGIQISGSESTFDAAVSGFDEQVNPVVDDIQGLLDTLEVDLYDKVDMIETSIGSAVEQIDSLVNQTRSIQSEIYSVERMENGFRTTRKAAVLAIFCVAFTFAFAGFVGLLASKISGRSALLSLVHLAWILSALFGSIALIIGSAFLLVNVALLDACQMSNIVTRDFEPYLGEMLATGANACFNDTNLAVAFNVTDKIDFQAKLDEGLAILDDVNITEQFSTVTAPLEEFESTIGTISSTALAVFNNITTFDSVMCPFNDVYTSANIIAPWNANIGKVHTTYPLKSTGSTGSYGRTGGETGLAYVSRIYDIAGKCVGSVSCCMLGQCNLNDGDWCTSGDDCSFLCSNVKDAIVIGYSAYLTADDREKRMRADLGVTCPAGYSCPTEEFVSMGHELTIEDEIDDYRVNITGVADTLVSVASTSVGEAMNDVSDFLCNMNVSFVEKRYDQVYNDVCTTLFGGIAQVNWAIWILAVVLEVTAILGAVLVVRLRQMDDDDDSEFLNVSKIRVRV